MFREYALYHNRGMGIVGIVEAKSELKWLLADAR